MKLVINFMKKSRKKHKHMGTKQHATKKNQWVNEEIKEDFKKYLETNENRNTTFQNLWGIAKTVLRGKFIVIQVYLKKQEKPHINNLTFHAKELEKNALLLTLCPSALLFALSLNLSFCLSLIIYYHV